MKKVVLKIEGMSCSACSNGLEKYLNKQKDIKEASVNLVMATATITYNDNLKINEIEKYIEEAGFKSLGEDKITPEEKKENGIPQIIFGILCLFIMYITMAHMLKMPEIPYLSMKYNPLIYSIVVFVLTIPFIIYAWDIIKSGIKNLIHGMPNMDTLVTIGICSSYIYSLYGTIMIILGNHEHVHNLYFESTVFVIFFIKLGKFISVNSKNKTTSAIRELVKLTPNTTHIKTEDGYKDITIDEVKQGDILICLPGEKIAVDGEIIKGSSNFDESFITGESTPVLKDKKSKVIAGSINYESTVEYKAERIGKDSTISEIVRLVVEATNTKAHISKIADIICSYFVPVIIILAILTFILNLSFGNTLSISIIRFVTVLVVACPCSLGLATPLALVISVGQSAKKGILIKDSESLEIASKIDTVIFDKTGTLTYGIPSLVKINNHSGLEEKGILELLISIEKYSNHPLAKGIKKYAENHKIKPTIEFITEDLSGYGVKATDGNNVYYACNNSLLKKLDIINSYEAEENEMAREGNSVIYLVKNKKVIATFGLADTLRKESPKIIDHLKKKNIDVIILSGDNEVTALKIAKELSIGKDKVISGVTPKEKCKYITKLVEEGHEVMMVGDGINDAPSLTSASIGVSLNSGTDIAINAANIILVNNNLLKIEDIITISKKTITNIKENLFWAFIYNILMIPIATGLISIVEINPMIACVAMVISSITVTFNALRLKKK